MMHWALLLLLGQSPTNGVERDPQQMVDAMVAATNTALPPGVRQASAAPRMLILHVIPPRGVDLAQFAQIYRTNSLRVVCSDPEMRRAADLGVTFRISVARAASDPAVVRDITSSSCAHIAAPIATAAPEVRVADLPPATGTPPAQEVLSAEQLDAIARTARAFAPRDQFDAPPALPSVNGRRFSYTVTPLQTGPNNMICNGYPSWGYWPNDSRLEVSATPGVGLRSEFSSRGGRMFADSFGVAGSPTFLTFRSFRCQKTRLPGYTATNAFGVSFNIERSRQTLTGIGDFETPDTSWRTYWTHQVAGDEARRLSRDVRVRISGSLRDWAAGRSVLCGTRRSRPTADRPHDEELEICLFNGRADLFEVVDAQTGRVLFSSPR